MRIRQYKDVSVFNAYIRNKSIGCRSQITAGTAAVFLRETIGPVNMTCNKDRGILENLPRVYANVVKSVAWRQGTGGRLRCSNAKEQIRISTIYFLSFSPVAPVVSAFVEPVHEKSLPIRVQCQVVSHVPYTEQSGQLL